MIRNRETAEHYTWGERCDGWRLLDRPDLTVIQERIPPGEAEVKHSHLRSRQVFYVLKGDVVVDLDGRTLKLAAGDAIEVVPGQAHRVRNTSRRAASLLVVSSPSTTGDREEHEPLLRKRKRSPAKRS